jgi:dihydropyrimidinase
VSCLPTELDARKGRLAVSSDAAIVVGDPSATKTIRAKDQISRIEYNVFEGFARTGAPVVTLSGGRIAWKDGALRPEKAEGKYVERPAFPPIQLANSTWKQMTAPKAVSRADATP